MNKKPAHPKRDPADGHAVKGRHGLGRGLGALISAAPAPVTDTQAAPPPAAPVDSSPAAPGAPSGRQAVLTLPVGEIARCPWQSRSVFDQEALRELSDSIKAHGVIQPLICRAAAAGGFELIAGERRLRAAIEAGLDRVPVIVMDAADRDAAEMAVIENIQREDLNVIEEAEGYRTLAETFNLTQQEVADRVGKSRPAVANALRLLDLPDEVKQLLSSSLLSTGHAKVLLGVSDPAEQTLLSHTCVTTGMTVRSLERLVARRRNARDADALARLPKPDLPDSHLKDLTERMTRHFGTQVRLTASQTFANGKRAKGCVEITFYDNDDLDRLLALWGVSVN